MLTNTDCDVIRLHLVYPFTTICKTCIVYTVVSLVRNINIYINTWPRRGIPFGYVIEVRHSLRGTLRCWGLTPAIWKLRVLCGSVYGIHATERPLRISFILGFILFPLPFSSLPVHSFIHSFIHSSWHFWFLKYDVRSIKLLWHWMTEDVDVPLNTNQPTNHTSHCWAVASELHLQKAICSPFPIKGECHSWVVFYCASDEHCLLLFIRKWQKLK